MVRAADAKREAPPRLRRALIETGRPYRCAGCGGDGTWNGRPLTLHVDHIDGRSWDCRPENLRFLCPNYHSQTATYAGRNRARGRATVVRVDDRGAAVRPDTRTVTGETERIAVLRRAEAKELTVADAARLLGCDRKHVYELQRRLRDAARSGRSRDGPASRNGTRTPSWRSRWPTRSGAPGSSRPRWWMRINRSPSLTER